MPYPPLSCKKSCPIQASVPEPLGSVNAQTVDCLTYKRDAPGLGSCYNNSRARGRAISTQCTGSPSPCGTNLSQKERAYTTPSYIPHCGLRWRVTLRQKDLSACHACP